MTPLLMNILRNDSTLNHTLDLHWVSPEERDAIRSDWLSIWNQVPYDDAFHAQCRERLLRCVPLAQGVKRRRRLQPTESQLVLVQDPAEPEDVFASLSHALPSMLWIPCGATPKDVLRALAPYLVEEIPALTDLPCSLRVVKTEITSLEVVENAVEALELWLDDTVWANSFNDDPWRSQQGQLNMLDQARMLRWVREDSPNRFESLSWRSLWSRSVLRVEKHPLGMWVFDLRYAPAQESKAMDFVNELMKTRFPRDLPIDLAASILRGSTLTDAYVQDLRARGEGVMEQAAITCAIEPAEMTSFETLRRLVQENRGDEVVLGDLARVASAYRHDAVLFEIMALTEGMPLGDELRQFLAPPRTPPEGSQEGQEVMA